MSSPDDLELQQRRAALAVAHGDAPVPAPGDQKVGIALNARSGLLPINGVRHAPVAGTSGWYIWAGEELSKEDDFFVPLHVCHLDEWCPAVLPYLELPPGWRFLIAPGNEDIWFDPDLDLGPDTDAGRCS